jgi:putative oxidoreductase
VIEPQSSDHGAIVTDAPTPFDPARTTMQASSNDRSIAAGTLVLRLALGTTFIAHALLKYYGFTLAGTAQFFESLGLPPALGYVTFYAELAGGVLLVLGVHTRQVAVALVPVLIGATWAHAGNGWLFSAPNGGWEYPAFLSLAAIAQALLGDGALALKPSAPIAGARSAYAAAR